MEKIILFVFLISALYSHTVAVTLNATVAIQNPSPPYQAGEQLTFAFLCDITVSGDDAYNINLTFGSDRLEFPSDPIASQFSWQYNRVDTPATIEDRTTIAAVDFGEGVDTETLWLLLTVSADSGVSRVVQGTFIMNIPDTIMPSDKISSFLTFSYDDQSSGGTTFPSVYTSDETYIENPYFDLSSTAFDANTGILMNIGDNVDATIVVALPRSIVDQVVEVELPYSGAGAVMTMSDDIQITTFGANLPCVGCVTVNGRSSAEENLEYNMANAEIGPLAVTTGEITEADNAMSMDFDFRLEDHDSVANYSEQWLMAGIMYGRTHIWVGQLAVTALVDEAERVPNLSTLTELGSHTSGEEIFQGDSVTISVDIWHCGQRVSDACGVVPSRGLAVDVKVVVILPPYVTFDGVIQWSNLDSQPTEVEIQDTLVQLQIGDISFSYEPYIEFNVTIDATGIAAGLDGTTFVALVEVTYSTKTGDPKASNLQGIDFTYTKPLINIGPTVPSLIQSNTCTCPFGGPSDCACCVSGASRCDNDYHEICVKTAQIASECPLSDLYDAGFLLHGSGSSLYACDASDARLDIQDEMCAAGDMSDNWYGMKKSTVNVLGFNQVTNLLYGIHKNTKTYMLSEDNGVTWVSISSLEYDDAASDPDFTSYERADTGASMSNGGYTVDGSSLSVTYNSVSKLVYSCASC